MTKASIICTVLNESNTITPLLESIKKQTQKPAEVIFVDAGSTDGTTEILRNFKQNSTFNIRIITSKGANRSQGRNLAIEKAQHSVIAVTDAGCILEKNWFERITKPLLAKEADAVAGYYLPLTPTPFQKALAPFVSVMPDTFDPTTYLPSSRSIAFTKKAWEHAGRYPKKLNYCEDLVFAMHLKRNTKMVIAANAIVYWTQKKTFKEFFNQIAGYAQGDIEAHYEPHMLKIATTFIRYIGFFIYPPIFVLYLIWSVYKHRNHVDSSLAYIFLPPLQITADFAVMWGALLGLSKKKIFKIPRLRLHIPQSS